MPFNIAKELERRRRKRVELRSQAQDSVNYQAQIRKQVDILRHKAEVERLQGLAAAARAEASAAMALEEKKTASLGFGACLPVR